MSLFHIILVLKYFLFLVSLTNADLLQVGLPSVLSLPLLFVTKYCNIFSVTGSFKDFVRESIFKFMFSLVYCYLLLYYFWPEELSYWSVAQVTKCLSSHWPMVGFITIGLRNFPIGPLPKLQNACVPIGLWW